MRPVFAMMLLISGLVAACGAAPVPKHLMKSDKDTELARLQGVWKLESLTVGEVSVPLKEGLGLKWEIRDASVTATSKGQLSRSTIRLDSVAGVKRLSRTDTRNLGLNGQPTAAEENLSFGYRLEGDQLTLATSMGAKGVRGAMLDPTKPGDDAIVYVFVRSKE